MKYRITQKETRQNFARVFKVGYCEIQEIEYFLHPIAYNSGRNGWNYDLYTFGCYAISTGYNPIGEAVGNGFIKHINEIVRTFYKEHANGKDYNICRMECELKIYNYISQYNYLSDFYELES